MLNNDRTLKSKLRTIMGYQIVQPDAMWEYRGQKRPDFALEPKAGQESVWDYPRPPRIVSSRRRVEVKSSGKLIASTGGAMCILETASPPTFYIPRADVDLTLLVSLPGNSFCEWKGLANYWALASDVSHRAIGWSYEQPLAQFAEIAGALSFYPSLVECTIDGERVRPQPGGFYGGWVTDEIVGPFKGGPGTGHW
jgi:uncharacterized protein (DUF427 family)